MRYFHIVIVYCALSLTGCGEDWQKAKTAIDHTATLADKIAWQLYNLLLQVCETPACVDKVRSDWKDIAETSDGAHKAICASNPQAEGCSK